MSKKLISLKKRIENLTADEVKIYRQWAHAFYLLPFYEMCNTPIQQLQNDVFRIYHEDPVASGHTDLFYVILCLDKKPDKGGDLSLVGCVFKENNKAFIEQKEKCYLTRKFPELDSINFFGFQGSWNEVSYKMLEANKVLSTRNPFRKISNKK